VRARDGGGEEREYVVIAHFQALILSREQGLRPVLKHFDHHRHYVLIFRWIVDPTGVSSTGPQECAPLAAGVLKIVALRVFLRLLKRL